MVKINGQNPNLSPKPTETEQQRKVQEKINTVFGGNKTKTIEREVDGKKTDIIVGKNAQGEKVRLDALTGEELVEKTTAGKNTYVTKSELEKQVTEQTGMTLQELKDNNIVPQFRHGQLIFVTPNGEPADRQLKLLQDKQKVDKALADATKEFQNDFVKKSQDDLKKPLEAQVEASKNNLASIEPIEISAIAKPQGAKSPEPPVVKTPKEPLAKRIANKPHSDDAIWFKAKDFGNGGIGRFKGKTAEELSNMFNISAQGPMKDADRATFKQQLITMNPSVFDKDGNIKKDADWNKLDIPNNKWVDEEYFGAKPTSAQKADKPVTSQEVQTSSKPQGAQQTEKVKQINPPYKGVGNRGIEYKNGNTIEAEDKRSVWDSDAVFNIGSSKYKLNSGMNTMDYGDLRKTYNLINIETGELNPNSKILRDRNSSHPMYFSGDGELNGAKVFKLDGKVAVEIKGKCYDLNAYIKTNKKVEIKDPNVPAKKPVKPQGATSEPVRMTLSRREDSGGGFLGYSTTIGGKVYTSHKPDAKSAYQEMKAQAQNDGFNVK